MSTELGGLMSGKELFEMLDRVNNKETTIEEERDASVAQREMDEIDDLTGQGRR